MAPSNTDSSLLVRHDPGGGEAIWSSGMRITRKLGDEQASGGVGIEEFLLPPGMALPPHTHERESETFYVLDGSIRFRIDAHEASLGRGGFVHVPRRVEHAFAVEGGAPARMLHVGVPGRMWEFHRLTASGPALGEDLPPADTPAPSQEELLEACASYGIKFAGPPMVPDPGAELHGAVPDGQGVLLRAGDGEAWWFTDVRMTLKATGHDTAGAMTILEALVPAGWGPPLHVHHRDDEVFYLLEGAADIVCGEARWTAAAGSFVLLPREVPHAFRVTSATPLRLVQITAPAQFEHFLREAGRPAESDGLPKPGPIDIPALIAAGAPGGYDTIGPPIQ